jgi:hypothetical protein
MMVNELDFEEIDQVLEDMSNLDGITNAIAEDVAKIDNAENVVKKTTPKKSKPVKKNVVKNTTKKAAPKPTPKTEPKAAKPAPQPKKAEKENSAEDRPGEIVMVKVKKQPVVEEEIVFQPNPKTGKFMDIVSPLSDMSIQGSRPSKNDVKITTEAPLLLTETSVVATITTPPAEDFIDKEDLVADRERIEEAGLNPDAPIGDLADKLEDITEEESDDPLDDILQSLDSQSAAAEDIADDVDDELEKLADILDIPDHSDAFLENVEISKRPLGGGEETASVIGAAAVDSAELDVPDVAEAKADKEFVEDSKGLEQWLASEKTDQPAEPAKPAKAEKKPKPAKPAKKPKSNNVVLYILLIVLFLILGASLGVLAFFSGLF